MTRRREPTARGKHEKIEEHLLDFLCLPGQLLWRLAEVSSWAHEWRDRNVDGCYRLIPGTCRDSSGTAFLVDVESVLLRAFPLDGVVKRPLPFDVDNVLLTRNLYLASDSLRPPPCNYGGSIPHRRDLVQNKPKAKQTDKANQICALWSLCALSKVRAYRCSLGQRCFERTLSSSHSKNPSMMSCTLGKLYNKTLSSSF